MLSNFKDGKLLPIRDAYHMAPGSHDILAKETTLGRVSVADGMKFTVVGDSHGQLCDFDHMLSLTGLSSPDHDQFVC